MSRQIEKKKEKKTGVSVKSFKRLNFLKVPKHKSEETPNYK